MLWGAFVYRLLSKSAAGASIFAMSVDEEVWLSREFIEARRGLKRKNKSLANLASRYVTNQVVTK